LRVEQIGGARSRPRQHELLTAPGIETIGPNADRNIEIKADCKTALSCHVMTGRKLLVGDPLHELDVPDGISVRGSKSRQNLVLGLSPFRRPFPPGPVEAPTQQFERGKSRQSCPALLPKARKFALPVLMSWRRKMS
jgi:hypothetical protein